jgi:hypothetical protein
MEVLALYFKLKADFVLAFFFTAREDKVITTNRSIVDSYQNDLNTKLGVLSKTLADSVDQQNKHLQSIEAICHSCLNFHDKVLFLFVRFYLFLFSFSEMQDICKAVQNTCLHLEIGKCTVNVRSYFSA